MKTNDNQIASHTPGPWIAEADWTIVDEGGFEVAHIEHSEHHKSQSEAEANARLIAAAPCLLAALQRLVHPMADDEDREHAEELIARITEGKA